MDSGIQNIYRLLFREQELRETRCLYEEICSGGGAQNYLEFYSSNIWAQVKWRNMGEIWRNMKEIWRNLKASIQGWARNSLFKEGKVGIILWKIPGLSAEGGREILRGHNSWDGPQYRKGRRVSRQKNNKRSYAESRKTTGTFCSLEAHKRTLCPQIFPINSEGLIFYP